MPGTFADNRFSKWDYVDPEDYPDHYDKNDVNYLTIPVELLTSSGPNRSPVHPHISRLSTLILMYSLRPLYRRVTLPS